MKIKTLPISEPEKEKKTKPGKRPRYLAHSYQYAVEGEDLPESPTTDKVFAPRIKATLLTALPIYALMQLGLGFLAVFVTSMAGNLQQFAQQPGAYATLAIKTALNPLNTAWYWHVLAVTRDICFDLRLAHCAASQLQDPDRGIRPVGR